jgi:hypothetical protein
MTQMLVPREMQGELNRLLACDDAQQLMAELESSLAVTLRNVVKIAAIVRRLEELGVEISLKLAILPLIRRIAYGQLVPELFVNLQGNSALLDRAASLPIPDQQRIADNTPVKVMMPDGDHRMVPPLSLTRREITQVFGKGKLRDDAEQVGWLRERMQMEQAKAATTGEAPVLLDRKRMGIVANGHFISVSDLARYVAELSKR